VYTVAGCPYTSVDSVFNHKNYYVNMQGQPFVPLQQQQAGADGGVPSLADTMRTMSLAADGSASPRANAPGALLSRTGGGLSARAGGLAPRLEQMSPYIAVHSNDLPAGAAGLVAAAPPLRNGPLSSLPPGAPR
jgi:hypothetical protein